MDSKQYTINERTYEITPLVTTRTGLAVHEPNSGIYYCLSYDTVVAVYDNVTRTLYRTWPGYSAATAKHIGIWAKLINSQCSTNYTYYAWKSANDYDGQYQFNTYAIRSRVPYTPPKMWRGYNEGRYIW